MLPIYYGTSFLTFEFCQISGLKEAFEKIFTILCMLVFPATEICTELCCQSTWGHLPQLSAKFEPWMKHMSVFDMIKQQHILKLILLMGITLFGTGIIS